MLGNNQIAFYNIFGFNINNSRSYEKIKKIRELFNNNEHLKVVCLLECRLQQIDPALFEIFPTEHYRIIYSKEGLGHMSIIRSYCNFRVKHRVINKDLVIQQIYPRDINNTSLLTANITYVKPKYTLNDTQLDQILSADLVGGDLNMFLDPLSNRANDVYFQDYIETKDYEHTAMHRTYANFHYTGRRRRSPMDGGPDFVIKRCDVSNRTVDLLPLLADHFGLIFAIDRDPTVQNPNNNRGRRSHRSIELVDKSKIDLQQVHNAYDSLKPNPTINDFRKIWLTALKPATTTRRVPINILNQQKLSPLGCRLKTANNREQLDEVWSELLRQTSNLAFLGPAHAVLNLLSENLDEAERCQKIEDLIARDVEEKSKFFQTIKDLLSNNEDPSQETINTNLEAKRYWKQVKKNHGYDYFRYNELKTSLRDLKNSTGQDQISINLLPRTSKPSHMRKFLYAINHLVFNSRKLPRWLLESRLTLIPKSNGVRPISGQSRVLVLIDSMIAKRLNSAIRSCPHYNNRYGFISNRNTSDLLGQQLQSVLEAKSSENSTKVGLVLADLTKAYDLTDWQLLTTKVYRFIKRLKQRRKFSCILGWLFLWLDDRRVLRWNNKCIRVRRGLPQGSPLSCTLFVIFYDYQPPANNSNNEDNNRPTEKVLYFADDSCTTVTANNNRDLLMAMRIYGSRLQEWADSNKMSISSSKSECILIDNHQHQEDYLLPYARKSSCRLLGIRVDEKLNFNCQIQKIKSWTKTRVVVIRRMSKLGLHENIKYRILNSMLNFLLYGYWWIHWLSNTNFSQLQNCWHQLVKATFNVGRSVPPKEMLQQLGLQSLEDTFNYRSAKNLMENRIDKAKPSLLDQALKLEKQLRKNDNNKHRTSTMSRRATTAAKTEKSLEDALTKKSGFPARLLKTASLCHACTKKHEKDWRKAEKEERKRMLRRIFLKDRKWPELSTVKTIVQKLNEEYAY